MFRARKDSFLCQFGGVTHNKMLYFSKYSMHCVQILGVFPQHIEVIKCGKSIATDLFVWKFWNIPENVLKI